MVWCGVSQETLQLAGWAWGTGQVRFLSDTHHNDFQNTDQWCMMGFSYTEGELIYVFIYFKTKAVMFWVCLYYAAYCTVQADGTLKREKLVVSVTLWEEWCRGLLEQFWRPNILHTHTHSHLVVCWLFLHRKCWRRVQDRADTAAILKKSNVFCLDRRCLNIKVFCATRVNNFQLFCLSHQVYLKNEWLYVCRVYMEWSFLTSRKTD